MKKWLSNKALPLFLSRDKTRAHIIVYGVFIGFILLDLVTSIICFQRGGFTETNSVYQIVGVWAFPLVYLIDAGILFVVERLRKHIRWSLAILPIPILAYAKACATNLLILYGGT